MSKSNLPKAIVHPGEKVCFKIYDCFENQFDSPTAIYEGIDWSRINPATGPVFISGAEPGDTLVVQVEKIEFGKNGVIFSGPNVIFKECIERNEIKRVEITENHAVFNDKLKIPLNPMIGVIGTSPSDKEISNGLPGNHGGNMDCKEIREGTTLFLPVNVPGALLAMGDLHAAMGDGEVTSGIEVSGEVIVGIELMKGRSWRLPIIVTKNSIITISSSAVLENAIHEAVIEMKDWLEKELNMDPIEASMLLSVVGDVKICQVVNPLKTVRMELPIWVVNQYGYTMPFINSSLV